MNLKFRNYQTLARREDMLRWALIFLVVALIAAVLGFGGIAGASVGIAKILFFAFLIIAAVMFLMNVLGGSKKAL
jgi:uncharacterized membrane protein YtjA (UPF0391 family)